MENGILVKTISCSAKLGISGDFICKGGTSLCPSVREHWHQL